MRKRKLITAVFTLVLFLQTTAVAQLVSAASAQSSGVTNAGDESSGQSEVFQGWLVSDFGGYYSESNGTMRLWSDGRDQGVTLYKEISPETDFEFSLQVKASRLDEGFAFGILVGTRSFVNFSYEGVNFEFHTFYGVKHFLLARYVNTVVYGTGMYGKLWDWHGFAVGEENTWYTMKLTVQRNPFMISGEVLDENGVSLGSYGVSDMINLSFEDITCLGFKSTWGGDYYVRNISDIGPISKSTIQTQISILPEVSSAALGSAVNIRGKLTDLNGSPLENEPVVLWYTFAGLNQWMPISSSFTNDAGDYSIQWINSASGNFTLRAEWSGNSTHLGASNTTTLSALPIQDETIFYVESNSTVSALAFNSTSSELGFSLTGPSGTTGFVRVTVAKSLVSNGADIRVQLDGKQLNYEVTSVGDSWLLSFTYSHSTHQVVINLAISAGLSLLDIEPWTWIAVATIIVAIGVISLAYFKKRKHPTNPISSHQQ